MKPQLTRMTMKKILLTAALCAMTLAAWGQPAFQKTGKSVADLHETRSDETVIKAEADINKDGIKDLVIALDGYYSGNNFAFYFGDKNGNYNLFREYETEMYGDKTGITVTDAGVVRIQCNYEGNYDVFLFRWQDGDFRLIGGKKDRHASEHYDESYNYLTGKMIRTDGEGKSRKAETTDMPKQPVINFGWIPLYYDMLDYLIEPPYEYEEDYILGLDDMLVWGIFRVMQANDMLFWHFCDWENPYRNPGREDEGTWYAEDEHLSPGSYNSWSALSFDKLADGSYLIDLSETFYDRSYESLFDEDMSNIDEILEEYETEEETTESRWIFKDGQFIPQEVPQPAAPEEEDEEITKTFRKVPLPADCEGVAYEAYKKMMISEAVSYDGEEIVMPESAPKGSTVSYFEDTNDIEGYYEERMMDCFPLLDGGWMAFYTWAGGAEGEATGYYNYAYSFIDGKLTLLEDFLPVPKNLDDFLNPDACEGQEELVAGLKAAYAGSPNDWLAYFFDPEEQTMVIQYRPLDPYIEEYETHVWSDECWELLNEFSDLPVYRWDGKRFVK